MPNEKRMKKTPKQTNSGIRQEGNWKEITDFAEKIEEAIQGSSINTGSVEKYSDWRPRREENEQKLKQKTIKEASLNKKKPEKRSKGSKDVVEASKKALEAGKKIGNKERPDQEVKNASKNIYDFLASTTISSTRKIERIIYSNMMLALNPYYFDTEDFSVDIRCKRNEEYVMDVNFPDKTSRKAVKKRFRQDN